MRFWEEEVVNRRRSGATAKAQKVNEDALASARARLAVAERMAEAAAKGEPLHFAPNDRASSEVSEYPIQGGKLVLNRRDGKLQIYFDDKPSKMVREGLKRDGFHWAPAIMAWQRQLTDNAKHVAERMFGLRLFEAPPAKSEPSGPENPQQPATQSSRKKSSLRTTLPAFPSKPSRRRPRR